jgi:hypothetical protein
MEQSMKYDHNFDVDTALRTIGKLDDYREFFRQMTTPAIGSVKAAYSFATREEAEAWLKGTSVPDGVLVSIADKGYQVVNLPQGARSLRNPLPQELESK